MGNMQPLEYKNIAGEEHLTFESIRRLVFNQLSDLSDKEARKHIDDCQRCKDIYTSLATPSEVRKETSNRSNIITMIGGILAVGLLIFLAAAFLYFGGSNRSVSMTDTETADQSNNNETSPEPEGQVVAPVLEAIDTLSQINDEPEVEAPVAPNKQFDSYIETEQSQPHLRLWGIYGKITGNGQPLAGVTVMVPGSSTARVSDQGGKYYIQVPRNTRELVFIYQGRQLVKELDPDSRRLDIHLKMNEMTYPEPESSKSGDSDPNVESL